MAVKDPGNTPLYVVAAVVTSATELPQLRQQFQVVKEDHFQDGAEMRSVRIRKNDKRRMSILRDLCSADFSLYLLVVDKRLLRAPGFGYPKSFVKHIYDRLYRNLFQDFHRVSIHADRVKNPPFMAELQRYLEKQHENSLFHQWQIEFVDSGGEVCVQAADMIAGSIARCFASTKGDEMLREVLRVLEARIVLFRRFPEYRLPATVDPNECEHTDHDGAIEARALSEAYSFLNTNGDTTELPRLAQVNCVQTLLSHYNIDPEGWVSTSALRRAHLERFGMEITARKFRLSVIGRLRDEGLLIASKRRGGYKIPTGLADMTEFVNTHNEKVKRMVDRVGRARQTVLRATDGRVDILAPEEFANLREAIQAMRQTERPGAQT